LIQRPEVASVPPRYAAVGGRCSPVALVLFEARRWHERYPDLVVVGQPVVALQPQDLTVLPKIDLPVALSEVGSDLAKELANELVVDPAGLIAQVGGGGAVGVVGDARPRLAGARTACVDAIEIDARQTAVACRVVEGPHGQREVGPDDAPLRRRRGKRALAQEGKTRFDGRARTIRARVARRRRERVVLAGTLEPHDQLARANREEKHPAES